MRMARLSELNLISNHQSGGNSHWFATQNVAPNSLIIDGILGMGLISTFDGEVELKLNDTAYTLNQSSFVVVNRGSLVTLKSGAKHSQPVVLLFKSTVAQLVAAELFHSIPPHDGTPNSLLNHQLIEHIHYTNASLSHQLRLLEKLGRSCASFQTLKADAAVRSIVSDLCNQNYQAICSSSRLQVKKHTTRTDLFKRLSMAKQWMEQNFCGPVDLEQVADLAMMDKAHFSRNFKAAFSTSPYQYLMNIRLNWAAEQLTTTQKPIQGISEAIGFDTPSSFSYQFKKWKGVSPRQLRKSTFAA